jgi:3-deoxy-D-manno-octulosonic-acid transferase
VRNPVPLGPVPQYAGGMTGYRILITLLWPLAALVLAWRVLRGREDWATWAERLSVRIAPGGPSVWLHAASNGELNSVRPVIAALRQARPDLRLCITCNSVTGRDLARSWGHVAQCAPLDTLWNGRAMLRQVGAVALWTVEAELWPGRHAACAEAGVPVAILGARLSPRTANGWRRVPRLLSSVLRPVALAAPQDDGSCERLLALGLPPGAVTGVIDLKSAYAPADLPPEPDLSARFPRARTWLAASTHEGEEEIAIAAHLAALADQPDLRLILAPRHAVRGDAVAGLLAGAGLAFERRSTGTGAGAPVLLADTMGEMARWYDCAALVLVGGSLTDRGGHTPFEPAAHGAALASGPHVSNFAAAYRRLAADGAVFEVVDAEGLGKALKMMADPVALATRADAARRALAAADPLAVLMPRLLAHLPTVKAGKNLPDPA